MICCEAHTHDAKPAWLLIPQMEHARLSGELARHWALGGARIEGELLAAIDHHDDGWDAWDRNPQIDPSTARPRSFTEMPLEDSLAIWSASITAAESIGPLAAWVVSGHFADLLQRSSDSHQLAAGQWLTGVDHRRQTWLADWQQDVGLKEPLDIARRSLVWLQRFDALSLWFCGAISSASFDVQTPCGRDVLFTSSDEVHCDPWPFADPQVSIQIEGRVLPVESVRDVSRFDVLPLRNMTWQMTRLPSTC